MTSRTDELKPIEEQLRQDLENADEEIVGLDEQVRQFGESLELAEGVDNHPGDDSDRLTEQERLLTIRQQLADRRAEMEHALSKVDEGSFGICERCRQEIPAGRLDAIPFARYCVECQEIVDQNGAAAK